jgi:hypothetical protein
MASLRAGFIAGARLPPLAAKSYRAGNPRDHTFKALTDAQSIDGRAGRRSGGHTRSACEFQIDNHTKREIVNVPHRFCTAAIGAAISPNKSGE